MRRAILITLAGLLATPLALLAGDFAAQRDEPASLNPQAIPFPPPSLPCETQPCAPTDKPAEVPWQTAWGVVGLHIFADGPKVAPNGEQYHPSFTLDLDFNFWLWRNQGFYLFSDIRFWAQRPENGVTNGRDGGLGFSKRQFDLSGGPAWNYWGPWEARIFGYSMNNLNRGLALNSPYGINDGFGVENRYYLTEEYAKLGQAGFNVARADFLSFGFYPTKEMVGNDGQLFNPGLLLRAYLTQDLWDWPCYAYLDTSYISKRSLHPKLLLLDVGVAARAFGSWRQWEFRAGVENTGDFEAGSVYNLWYVSARYVF